MSRAINVYDTVVGTRLTFGAVMPQPYIFSPASHNNPAGNNGEQSDQNRRHIENELNWYARREEADRKRLDEALRQRAIRSGGNPS